MKEIISLLGLIFCCQIGFSQDIIIKDVYLISMTSDKVEQKQSILINNGKITAIGKYKNLKKNASTQVINGKNKYLMPGLADMHLHLPTEEKVDSLLLHNVQAGITHIRVMNSELNQVELKQRLKDNPSIISPTLHFSQLVTRDMNYNATQFDSLMLEVKKQGLDFVKLFSLADKATFENLMQAAKKQGITVCGHYPKYAPFGKWVLVDMKTVLESGFKSIEHLGGYEMFETEEDLKAAILQTKEHQLYNCPTLDWDLIAYNLFYPEDYKNRLTYPLFPATMIQDWEKTLAESVQKENGEETILSLKERGQPLFEKKQKTLKMLADYGCLLLLGSDSGSLYQGEGLNVYEEMNNWSKAGLANYNILKAATITAAQFFNQQDQWGTIEVGKNGDVILLDKNPLEAIGNITTIQLTILKGKVYLARTN